MFHGLICRTGLAIGIADGVVEFIFLLECSSGKVRNPTSTIETEPLNLYPVDDGVNP